MNYIDFEVGNKAYKLRLTTKAIVALEKNIGCNPLAIFGAKGDTIPKLSTMVAILHASLQALEHGITMDAAYDIFDEFLESGKTMIDFIPIILELYKASGLIKDDGDNEKN